MKRNFEWMSITRVLRSVVRVLTRRRFQRKNKEQVVEKTELVVDALRTEPLRSVGGATTGKIEKSEKKDGVSPDKTTSWGFVDEEKSEAPSIDAGSGLDGAKTPEILTETALDETSVPKKISSEAQLVENKTDRADSEEAKNGENGDVDEPKQEASSFRSTEDAILKNNAQLPLPQGIREWINDEGKIVVRAALEIELSARSTKFAFLRSARGTLYRYPLRRLSLADRVWIGKALGINLDNKTVADDIIESEKSVATIEVAPETPVGASEDVATIEVAPETPVGASEDVATIEVAPETPSAVSEGVATIEVAPETPVGASEDVATIEVAPETPGGASEDANGTTGISGDLICADVEEESETFANDDEDNWGVADWGKKETLQPLLEQELEECDDEDLSLDFDDDDATSPNMSEAGEEEGSDDATSDDLRLNFWEDWEAVSKEATTEKTAFDNRTQLKKLNELSGKGEREQRERQDVETSTKEAETRHRKETEKDARRKNATQRNVKSSGAKYYEPFSMMEPETLDGLYDYYGDLDELRDEIETERIIDYYDWTYGDARYRDESDEWE